MNQWLGNECKLEGVQYLDVWQEFYDRRLYKRDGVHLNEQGKDVMASRLDFMIGCLVGNK